MDAIFSKMLKTGSTTYFLDVKESKNNKKYLSLTASQPAKDGEKKFTKRSVIIFSSVMDEFVSALKDASSVVGSTEGDFTKKLKTGKISYFVDVKESKNKTRYFSITESQPSKEDPKKYSKRSIAVFNNVAKDFVGYVEEAANYLK